MDIKTLVYDRARRAILKDSVTGKVTVDMTDIGSASLNMTQESEEVVDARSAPIMSLATAKGAEFSGDTLMNFMLLGAQTGSGVKEASGEDKIRMKTFEVFEAGTTPLVLKETPVDELKAIYQLGGDGLLGKVYEVGTDANADKFAFDSATKTITLPTSLTTGQVFVEYDYMSDTGLEVENLADSEPYSGEFAIEALLRDPCNKARKYGGYIIFPKAEMDGNVDLGLSPTDRHPFTVRAVQEYCGSSKRLFRVVVRED